MINVVYIIGHKESNDLEGKGRESHNSSRLTRFPMEGGILPFRWFEDKSLFVKEMYGTLHHSASHTFSVLINSMTTSFGHLVYTLL